MCAETFQCRTAICTLVLATTTLQSQIREPTFRRCLEVVCNNLFRFPREEKKTRIEKTYAPGPGSYHAHSTVGMI